ncbi:MAG: class I SAM-dependent methyltransferase [Candidatus Bathyarchaeia archaeon]
MGTVAPSEHEAVSVDLGCGHAKAPGFIGLDRYKTQGVDVVADLQSLPIASGSVDLVLASHSLEHVNDLPAAMREIYRICRHSAQVVIISPYSNQSLSIANPYHKQAFNEHTPRFWTSCDSTLVPKDEYCHPHASNWGLAESDSSVPGIDLRCLRIEFFYFPEYRHIPIQEQRIARQKYLNVCDQIAYHLIVSKEPMSEGELLQLSKRVEYYEPPYVTVRKLQERCESMQAELKQMQALRAKGTAMAEQLESMRNRRIIRWMDRIFDKSDARDIISPPFYKLRDDSLNLHRGLKGFRLRSSVDLRTVQFVTYPLDLTRPGLAGILLAPVIDWYSSKGLFGIEIVSSRGEMVAQATISVRQIDEAAPTSFAFTPIQCSGRERMWLRVFARDVDGPIRMLEWQRYSTLRLGALQTRAFCGFLFESAS